MLIFSHHFNKRLGCSVMFGVLPVNNECSNLLGRSAVPFPGILQALLNSSHDIWMLSGLWPAPDVPQGRIKMVCSKQQREVGLNELI